MKKALLLFTTILFTLSCFAQQELAFPFQGGKEVMNTFFKENVDISTDLAKKKATGNAIFKFTSDTTGTIKKIIVYYADDVSLIKPIIDALQKSDGKWVIPFRTKTHDFIIPFHIVFTHPTTANAALQKAVYDFQRNSQPVLPADQIPLDMVSLLPTVVINYQIN
ncbi:hypothetical protein [Mucilaginibacter auburnensis]|uniref:TonB-like protein n=1 Tax=Mucilaginibacter auburnensis TaxID=1457233 RepID=A0A2H9VPH9_9SPHI|nr:hypothetical protein [Mucilaginibacter auburnensis]PJJ80227.1 hypothetical protein CLV57_3374 [Mucilaginibacter auburnensis]